MKYINININEIYKYMNTDFTSNLYRYVTFVHLRTALFWAITHREVLISYRRFVTDNLSRNVVEELPLHAA